MPVTVPASSAAHHSWMSLWYLCENTFKRRQKILRRMEHGNDRTTRSEHYEVPCSGAGTPLKGLQPVEHHSELQDVLSKLCWDASGSQATHTHQAKTVAAGSVLKHIPMWFEEELPEGQGEVSKQLGAAWLLAVAGPPQVDRGALALLTS